MAGLVVWVSGTTICPQSLNALAVRRPEMAANEKPTDCNLPRLS